MSHPMTAKHPGFQEVSVKEGSRGVILWRRVYAENKHIFLRIWAHRCSAACRGDTGGCCLPLSPIVDDGGRNWAE